MLKVILMKYTYTEILAIKRRTEMTFLLFWFFPELTKWGEGVGQIILSSTIGDQ
jgi:hypothetical protein